MLKHGKKKNSDVAYVPIAPTTKSVSVAPTKIDIPNYPDQGVSFQGYSKTLLQGNQFKLNKQDAFDANFAQINIAAPLATYDFTLGNNVNLKSFITSFSFSCNIAAASTQITLTDISTGVVKLRFFVPTGIYNYVMTFDTPIEFSTCNARLTFGGALAVGDDFTVNVYGWEE